MRSLLYRLHHLRRKYKEKMTSSLQAMRDLLAEDQRYKLDAYQFIRESLQYAHEHMIGELAEDESGEKTGHDTLPVSSFVKHAVCMASSNTVT